MPKTTPTRSQPSVPLKPAVVPSKLSPKAIRQIVMVAAFVVVFVGGALSGISFENHIDGVDLSQFWQVYRLIQQNYVGSISKTQAATGATTGLVESLGDPFSQYLTAADLKDLNTQLSGQFQGIGAELIDDGGNITVQTPLAGSPAEAAGLKANDIIEKVNGESTGSQSLNDVVGEIRGPVNTKVTLTVDRAGQTAPLDIVITRQNINVPSVSSKMVGDVAYLQITQFGTDTVANAQKAVKSLSGNNPKALVIDLRDDPGGYLEDVPPIAGLFLPPSSVVVKEAEKDGQSETLRTSGLPVLPNTPIYVLTNGGSASAAEILAGALQDSKRATLVGEQTFGKGSVQDVIDLPGNTALRITIAKWLTPSGHSISRVGLTPDVKVTDDRSNNADPVLAKALSLANQ